jgi:hypothetical protein
MYSVVLHQRLMRALADDGVRLTRPQQRNLAMLCVAFALNSDCRLGSLALWLPLPARHNSSSAVGLAAPACGRPNTGSRIQVVARARTAFRRRSGTPGATAIPAPSSQHPPRS